ncbi:MAG: DUF5659 domain-containing protein [Candidatus Omnitrophica bacterium]|nr:DUF5659 domain-containing protein [Candidatus Omnitrophota bacterium]
MENLKEFSTKDFYLSACLLASGLILKRLEKNQNNFMTFVFEDPDNLAEKIIKNHWNRKHKIPTRDLIEAINELKTRIYSGF